jgi:electron transfer flavoprotein alpha subunit
MAKGTWVVVDQRDGKIRKVSLELISKARDFGDEVAAVIMGQGIEGLAAFEPYIPFCALSIT